MGNPTRGNWSHWLEFFFSCIGVTVGLGNIWRFPYICYKNGGGAFLIPYVLFLFLMGTPGVFLQFTYAQYSNLGPGKIWECCPLFRGVGYGMMALTLIISLYYNVIIGWVLYYFGMSFSSTIPWSNCENEWNTPMCYIRSQPAVNLTGNFTELLNETLSLGNHSNKPLRKTPPEEFWENKVLELTDGIQTVGSFRVELFFCVLATAVITLLCTIKGIKTSGKVMYVAATIPYVFLFALLIRGLTLPGAIDGLKFYMIPRWKELLKLSVWFDAGIQVMYSLSLCTGALIALASHNKFSNNIYRDAILLPVLDALTSWFAGCVIFVTLGYMAKEANISVADVIDQGPGVAFMVYPEALATLAVPQLWSALFFLMLFMVGLDTQIVHVQLLYTGFTDTFPNTFGNKRLLTVTCLIFIPVLIGLIYITQGGMYILQLTDWYISSISILVLTGMEAIVLAWIYGTDRLLSNIEAMIGYKPTKVWVVLWKCIAPSLLVMLWLVGVIQHRPVTYGSTIYPGWSIGLGWIIAIAPLLPIPVVMVQALRSQKGSLRERIKASLKPTVEWKPAISCIREDISEENTKLNDIY